MDRREGGGETRRSDQMDGFMPQNYGCSSLALLWLLLLRNIKLWSFGFQVDGKKRERKTLLTNHPRRRWMEDGWMYWARASGENTFCLLLTNICQTGTEKNAWLAAASIHTYKATAIIIRIYICVYIPTYPHSPLFPLSHTHAKTIVFVPLPVDGGRS